MGTVSIPITARGIRKNTPCCALFSSQMLLKLESSSGPASLSPRAAASSSGSPRPAAPQPRLRLPACCNTAGTRNQAGVLGGKLARMLRGKQAGTARLTGEGRQSVTGGTKAALDGLGFLLRGIFGRSCLARGCVGLMYPPSRQEHGISCPSGWRLIACFFGKLLCNPES